GETEAQLSEPHNMRRLLSKVLPDPDRVELIRQRVYTHNARLAERFRPYVSAALPHGVRRFEFMVMPGETEAQLSEPHNMRRLLSKVLPDPDRVELIRQR
ncbi:hypothetical protein CKQ90_30490, partial [Klebsiella pneumoniae]